MERGFEAVTADHTALVPYVQSKDADERMDPLTISAASGMRSRMESLDMLANNIANSGTAGFKKDVESYSLYLSEAAADLNADLDPVTALLPVIERQWTDLSPGATQPTGNPLDIAIDGDGYLAVDGPGGTMYTRSGRLRVSSTGTLETLDGYRVRMQGGAAPLDGSRPVDISASGYVSQGGQAVGRISLVRFADSASLVKTRGAYFRSSANALPATGAGILVGQLEASNVNNAESAVRLINVMRQFEMLNKAAHIGSDMNRQVVEIVAKVGS